MKFLLIVFLGLFAISAQAKPSDTLDASISQSAYNVISQLLSVANALNKKVQSITMNTIKGITNYIVYKGSQKVSSSWAEVEEKLKEFEVGYATACVKKNLPLLKEAKNKLQDDITACVEPLVEKSEKAKEELKETVKNVKETINGYYIPTKCAMFNPLASARCIKNHMVEFKDLVMKLVWNTEAQLENAIKSTTAVSKEATACINHVVADYNKMQKAMIELFKLICKKR